MSSHREFWPAPRPTGPAELLVSARRLGGAGGVEIRCWNATTTDASDPEVIRLHAGDTFEIRLDDGYSLLYAPPRPPARQPPPPTLRAALRHLRASVRAAL